MSRKKITYTVPRMGYTYAAFESFFKILGYDVIIPEPTNTETIKEGVSNSPEYMCFPFKILLGQFERVLEKNPDRYFKVVSLESYGPCRFGYYSPLYYKILRDKGFTNFEIVNIEGIYPPLYKGIPRFFKKLVKLTGWHAPWTVVKAFVIAGWKVYALEQLEKKLYHLIPREKVTGSTEKIFNAAVERIRHAPNKVKAIKKILNEELEKMENNPHVERDDLPKIGLVGEAYILMDYSNNLDIEKKLAYMGVDVDRSLRVTNWTLDRLIKAKSHKAHMLEVNKGYLDFFIGGDGQESIMNTILYKKAGYDGVIQAQPFGCLPETAAKEILTKVSEDYDIPVLSLAFDEQTGEAGFVTRLEAFVDMIKSRRQMKEEKKESVTVEN
ncbi:acyl-CoA dehydratase activase-related protein [Athalassotoga saccharophila]|uniref:acyl-CoA dehydratase activase-related protein n=1 Tax=Athalassotoga saccharophila TaxID=1441386 RepID=UPI00137B3672|nr:acyl-CoA dehydratase activase-related protein [Athalassotoga saccharophila]BBJ27927.1 activator of (R)-2-hydroxyglutaryl-CoA dehydratase [Athalassotoga saccharophila]